MSMKLLLPAALALALAPAAAQASFPGDNGLIAFNWTFGCDGSMVATMHPDGSDRRLLTADACQVDGPPRAAYPDWAADGESLVFMRDNRLYTMAADGSGQAPLPLPAIDSPARPSLAPGGKRVAFTRIRNATQWIYTARIDGRGERRLRAGSSPRWSPNGRSIAYASPTGDLIVARARDGRIRHRVARPVGQLDWSPDGRRLVYTSRFGGVLRIVRADGRGRPRPLARRVRRASSPVWSPDGRRIAFVRALPAGEEELKLGVYTVRARGGRPKLIFPTSEERVEETLEALTLSWQPR